LRLRQEVVLFAPIKQVPDAVHGGGDVRDGNHQVIDVPVDGLAGQPDVQ